MKIEHEDIANIDLTKLVLVVERNVWREGVDHSRWIFRTRDSQVPLIYKIWNPGYVRRDNVLTGLEAGLYNENTVPALKAIIMAGGVCRGYVMAKGTTNRKPSSALARALWEATWASGYFLAQYRVSHTITAEGVPSLIDLEAVHAVKDEPKYPVGQVNIEDPDYAELIHRMQTADLTRDQVAEMAERHITRARGTSSADPWISRKWSGGRKKLIQAQKRWFGDSRELIEQ